MKCLTFTVSGGLFAVDVALVMKMAREIIVTPVTAAPPTVMGLANLRGRIITILNLDALLNERRGEAPSEKKVNAVVFKPFTLDGDLMGLSIDKPGDLVDIDEESIHEPPRTAGTETDMLSMAEAGGKFYRIIDIASIVNKFSGRMDEK